MTEEQKQENRLRIGRKVATIRKEKGLSIRELAEQCGVSYQNITKIENGKYNVSIDILWKLCEVLNCKLDIIKIPQSKYPWYDIGEIVFVKSRNTNELVKAEIVDFEVNISVGNSREVYYDLIIDGFIHKHVPEDFVSKNKEELL